MSYFIGKIIYGIPATDSFQRHVRDGGIPKGLEEFCDENGIESGEELLDHLFGDDPEFFETGYSAGGEHVPAWCGVKIGEFDECTDYIALDKINIQPTPEQKAEAESIIEVMPAELRKHFPPVGVYVISTSS